MAASPRPSPRAPHLAVGRVGQRRVRGHPERRQLHAAYRRAPRGVQEARRRSRHCPRASLPPQTRREDRDAAAAAAAGQPAHRRGRRGVEGSVGRRAWVGALGACCARLPPRCDAKCLQCRAARGAALPPRTHTRPSAALLLAATRTPRPHSAGHGAAPRCAPASARRRAAESESGSSAAGLQALAGAVLEEGGLLI